MFVLLQVHLGVCPYLGKVPLCLPHWIVLFNLIYFMMKRIDKRSCMSLKRKQSGTSFTQVRNLKQHQRVHMGKKSYKCKQCGKCFRGTVELTTHERVHTGKKRCECKHCGKCFSRVRDQKRHERVHTGERPYECKQCGKCFSQAVTLKVHAWKSSYWREAIWM